MGGLFSSNEEPTAPNRNYFHEPPPTPRPSTTYSYSYERQPQQPRIDRNYIHEPPPRPRPSTTYSYSFANRQRDYFDYESQMISKRLESLRISRQATRHIESPKRSTRNTQLVNSYTTVTYTALEPYDPEYLQITKMITNKKNFKVDSIEKIENPFLEKAFELKKLQKEKQFGFVQERLLFHGTKWTNMNAICTMNFNWRLCQAHKYGKGVSFSPNSTYASVYSDEGVYNKVMIVAKVLIGGSCIGNKFMELPPDGCDTSQKGNDGIVIVKFEDNEFCPVYKIKYHVRDESVGKRPGYNKRGRNPRQNLAGARAMPVYDDIDDFDYFYDD